MANSVTSPLPRHIVQTASFVDFKEQARLIQGRAKDLGISLPNMKARELLSSLYGANNYHEIAGYVAKRYQIDIDGEVVQTQGLIDRFVNEIDPLGILIEQKVNLCFGSEDYIDEAQVIFKLDSEFLISFFDILFGVVGDQDLPIEVENAQSLEESRSDFYYIGGDSGFCEHSRFQFRISYGAGEFIDYGDGINVLYFLRNYVLGLLRAVSDGSSLTEYLNALEESSGLSLRV